VLLSATALVPDSDCRNTNQEKEAVKYPALNLLSEISLICRLGHTSLTEQLVDQYGRYESEITALSLSMSAVRHAENCRSFE